MSSGAAAHTFFFSLGLGSNPGQVGRLLFFAPTNFFGLVLRRLRSQQISQVLLGQYLDFSQTGLQLPVDLRQGLLLFRRQHGEFSKPFHGQLVGASDSP